MATYRYPVTPAEITGSLKAFCKEIVPESNPIYIDVIPVQGAAENECFPNVKERIKSEGGTLVQGWSIWILPTLYIEAEFHAVWQTKEGNLLDITPKKNRAKRILFLPDLSRKYEERQINNIRKPLQNHPSIIGFLTAFNEEYELMNRGERAYQTGEIILESEEALEYEQIQKKKLYFEYQMMQLIPEIDLYDPCPCSSGKKVKWCCGMN